MGHGGKLMNYFRKGLISTAMLAGLGLASQSTLATPTAPFNECPAINYSNSCAILFEFGAGGTVNTYFDTTQGAYDGSDDVLVGVLNNSSSTVYSLTLTGYGNGGGIFDFDGDGLSYYTGQSYGSTGYEGPNTSFSNITTITHYNDTGTVNFTGGLAAGKSLYFSLEGSPDSIQQGGGIKPQPSSVPEPGSLALFGLGLVGLALKARHRKAIKSA